MKSYVYKEPYKIELEERVVPEPGANQVRVRVKAAAICGSDTNGFKGKSAMRVAPLVMGHEFSGVVDAVGENVEADLLGARVSANPAIPCGECFNCRTGKFNVCDYRFNIGTTMKAGPWDGAFAEYVIVPKKNLIMLPENISFEEAALLEPAAVSLRAAKMMGDIAGKTVTVFGAGPIGLLAMQAARALGADKVIAIDMAEARLELALSSGIADYVINTKNEDAVAKVLELTEGKGAYASLDAVGINVSLNSCIALTRNSGTVSMVGMASETIDGYTYKACVTREMNLKGSYCYINEIQEAADLLHQGKLNFKILITAVPMEKIQQKFEELVSGQSKDIKVVLTNE